MTAKQISKNSNIFENINERGESGKDIYKSTVKITTFSSKEEKWVQHSYEETHINRARQLNSLKTSSSITTSDSAEGIEKIENFSSILEEALKNDSSSENSQSEEDKQRLREINEFLMNSTSNFKLLINLEKIKKMYQEESSGSSLKYLDVNKIFPDKFDKLENIDKIDKFDKFENLEKTEKKKSPNFAKTTEENLRKELENILLQVYLEHINKTKDFDIKVFENHINFCSESFNKKFNLYILQLLSEKITVVVEKIKDRIYSINEVRLLKEKFYELKTSHDVIKGDCLEKARMLTNRGHKGMELNEKIKKAIREMLIELRENIYAVLESSYDIQKIFIPIVQHLVDETCMNFNFEEIHREEFSKAVAKDEFLKIIFLQIISNSKNQSYEELFDILTEIEDILKVSNKEMTRFRKFIDLVLEKMNLNVNINSVTNNLSKECQHFNLIHNTINHTCNCSHQEAIPIKLNPNIINLKKDKFKDIDDLIDYINKEEEEEVKPKKNKKKNNKKDKKQNATISYNIPIDKEKMEKEIEEFKVNIKNESINAYSIRKIRPKFSRKWLNNLGSEVKSI